MSHSLAQMTRGFGRRSALGGCGWDETGTIENLERLDDRPLSHLAGCLEGCTGVGCCGDGVASLSGPGDVVVVEQGSGVGATVYGLLATASMAVSVYHGYKRNDDLGYGLWWGLMGALFPVITPVIAVAQGFAEPAKK